MIGFELIHSYDTVESRRATRKLPNQRIYRPAFDEHIAQLMYTGRSGREIYERYGIAETTSLAMYNRVRSEPLRAARARRAAQASCVLTSVSERMDWDILLNRYVMTKAWEDSSTLGLLRLAKSLNCPYDVICLWLGEIRRTGKGTSRTPLHWLSALEPLPGEPFRPLPVFV